MLASWRAPGPVRFSRPRHGGQASNAVDRPVDRRRRPAPRADPMKRPHRLGQHGRGPRRRGPGAQAPPGARGPHRHDRRLPRRRSRPGRATGPAGLRVAAEAGPVGLRGDVPDVVRAAVHDRRRWSPWSACSRRERCAGWVKSSQRRRRRVDLPAGLAGVRPDAAAGPHRRAGGDVRHRLRRPSPVDPSAASTCTWPSTPRRPPAAAARTGGRAAAPGPLVPERFTSGRPDRAAARASASGLPADQPVVLLVAGSWGIGEIEPTFDEVAATGRFVPLAVCGNNERLRRRLAAKGTGVVLGWTDEMPAADGRRRRPGGERRRPDLHGGVRVGPARRDLPPHRRPRPGQRPGHGPGRSGGLRRCGRGPARRPGHRGRDGRRGPGGRGPGHVRRRRRRRRCRRGAPGRQAIVPSGPVRPAGGRAKRRPPRIRQGVAAAVAAGAPCSTASPSSAWARPPPTAWPWPGPRTTPSPPMSGSGSTRPRWPTPTSQQALAADQVTAIVSGRMAAEDPNAVGGLAAAGVDVANGGWGGRGGFRWSRAQSDVVRSAHAIRAATNERIRFVRAGPAGRRLRPGVGPADRRADRRRQGRRRPSRRPGSPSCGRVASTSSTPGP